MMLDRIFHLFSRGVFVLALAMLVVAIIDIALSLADYSILRFAGYSAGRMIELSAAMLIFVAVILLRQIRDRLGK